MKFIPKLFSTPMVQAIQENRKTKTRKTKGLENVTSNWAFIEMDESSDNSYARFYDSFFNDENNNPTDESYKTIKCPYGKPGDVIWVRETFLWVMLDHAHDLLVGSMDRNQYAYKASIHNDWIDYAKEKYNYKWKPNIHMPKAAARYFLKIKSITVERLQDITEADAIAEGVGIKIFPGGAFYETYSSDINFQGIYDEDTAKDSFRTLWQSINGEESWKANPFVWVIEFERIEKPENFC